MRLLILCIGLTATLIDVTPGRSDNPAAEVETTAREVKLVAEMPKESPTLDDVNAGRFVLRATLDNVGTEDLVLYPFLSVEVLDADGKAAPTSTHIGRWGVRKTASILEGIKFITLKPGQSHKFDIKLSRYTNDAEAIRGWKLPAAGEHKLVLRYRYDRDETKKRFGKGCTNLDDADAAWNRALETEKKLELKLDVKPNQ